MQNPKKEFLNRYILQERKILRYEKLINLNPKYKNKYDRCIKNANNLRIEIENIINEIDDDLLVEILFQKYIFGKTLEEISLILNYSKRHIERLHIKALEKIKI